ncbi:MAG: serine hydrolase [Saprospiraceae bacterium]
MKSSILVVFSLCIFTLGRSQETVLLANKEDFTKKTEQLVKTYLDLDIFSGVVVIAQKGIPIYSQAFGMANKETKIKNTLETKFAIGSMNKSFTRIVILQLVEARKLKLSDKLVNFLDGFKQNEIEEVTIDHLLNHRSGFGDYHMPIYWDLPYDQKNIQGLLPLIKELPLLFKPGSEREYSNAGYILLGAIIEKVTGKTFAQNVVHNIKEPLNLKSLVVYDVKNIPNKAIGYTKTFSGYEANEFMITEPRSDGGFYATAADILSFYRAFFYGNKLISQKTKNEDEFFTHIEPLYLQNGSGIPLAGGFNGSNTVHLEMLADDISIVVFANMDEPVAEKIAWGIFNIIKGKTPDKAMLPAKLNVYIQYKKQGLQFIQDNFENLTTNWFEGDPKDLLLNNLGYDLMNEGKLKEAQEIFKLNTELFPNIGNCWDSYGELLLLKGDKVGALQAYKKALVINPNIPSAQKMVKELEK